MPYIQFTGIGTDESGIHTKKRFRSLMKKYKHVFEILDKNEGTQRVLPHTLDEWVKALRATKLENLPEGFAICPKCGAIGKKVCE